MQSDALLKERIRNPKGKDLIVSAEEAADLIKDGMIIGVSGFTPSDDPKLVPLALAARKKAGDDFKVDIYSGASLGVIDSEMVKAGIVGKRLPFCNNEVIRKTINDGQLQYIDMHLSQSAQYMNYGFLPKIDMALVEVLAITEDGDLVPSIAVGNTAAFVRSSDSVIVEIAMEKPLAMEGMHDIAYIENPPDRREIPIYAPGDRIGEPVIKCGWDKIKAIVISHQPDCPHKMAPIDDNSKRIAENIIKSLEAEKGAGRLGDVLPPIQSGLGNVANALLMNLRKSNLSGLTAYTEIVQDGMLYLIEDGKMKLASATCCSLSEAGFRKLFSNIDFFKEKIVLRPQEISNNPEIIRRLGIISINTAIEMDIYGNINSSHIMGKKMMNGIGGSGDFSINAGISIFTTPSIAKNGDISSIVPMCSHVDHTEHEVMVVVTEQGYADLRGLSPKERAVKIIENCAHPDYRKKLMDYFDRACREMPCQTPHILDEALSWHSKYEKTGSMK